MSRLPFLKKVVYMSRRLSIAFLLGSMACLLSGCAINPHQNCCDPVPHTDSEMAVQRDRNARYMSYVIPPTSTVHWERPIFLVPSRSPASRSGALLLLHEYPYLNSNTFSLAEKLSRAGYNVYLPTLFGEPLKNDTLGNSLYLAFSPDWKVIFSEHNTSPIIVKLRVLAEEIDRNNGRHGIGVIGQCLTGALPLALLSEPCVKAVVCAQPATPLIAFTDEGKRSLGLSLEDVAKASCSRVKIFSVRFKGDMISPPARLAAFPSTFPNALPTYVIPTPVGEYGELWTRFGIAPHAHPTLTYCLPRGEPGDSLNPVNEAYNSMVSYLDERLK